MIWSCYDQLWAEANYGDFTHTSASQPRWVHEAVKHKAADVAALGMSQQTRGVPVAAETLSESIYETVCPFFIEASPVDNIDASHFYPSNLEAAALMNWDFWYSSKNTARLCGMHRCCRSESYCQLSLLLSQSTDEVNHLSATGWWVSDHRHLSSTIHACSKGMASLLPLRRFAEG